MSEGDLEQHIAADIGASSAVLSTGAVAMSGVFKGIHHFYIGTNEFPVRPFIDLQDINTVHPIDEPLANQATQSPLTEATGP